MTYENYIKGKLIDYAASEGMRYGSADCALAIMQVVANRVGEGWEGGDWLKVLKGMPDTRGTTYKDDYTIDPRSAVFRQLLVNVEDIYHRVADDTNVNVTDDRGKLVALYYCEAHNVTEPWFKQHILADQDTHPRIAKVGELTFFA